LPPGADCIRLWDVGDGRCTRILSYDNIDFIWSAAFSPDGRTLAAAGRAAGAMICFWDLLNDRNNVMPATTVDLDERNVSAIIYFPDGQYLACGADESIQLWNVTDHSCLPVLHGDFDEVRSVSFSPNSKLLASGSYDGSIRLSSVEKKTCLLVLPNPHFTGICSVAFSPNGQTLASGGVDETVRLWNPCEEKHRDEQCDWEKLICLWNCKP
jgi:hypothetical protein